MRIRPSLAADGSLLAATITPFSALRKEKA